MGLSKMKKVEFNDDFEEDIDLCYVCGCLSETLVGYNEKENLCKYECKECHAVYIVDDNGNYEFLNGKPRKWGEYMSNNLSFPFKGIVDETPDYCFDAKNKRIKYGDKIVIQSVDMDNDLYGVIVVVKKGLFKYSFPLCDIMVEDESSANFKIVDAYRDWFANCR